MPARKNLKFWVGPLEYELAVSTKLLEELNHADELVDGLHIQKRQLCVVREGLSPHYERAVAFHEAAHAETVRVGLNEHKDEEKFIELMTPAQYDTLLRNPEWRDYLFGSD